MHGLRLKKCVQPEGCRLHGMVPFFVDLFRRRSYQGADSSSEQKRELDHDERGDERCDHRWPAQPSSAAKGNARRVDLDERLPHRLECGRIVLWALPEMRGANLLHG